MALEATFRELFRQLKRLKEMLDPLLCLLPDDPLNMEVALVQHLRESVETVSGWLDECLEQSQTAQDALGHSADLNRSRRALRSMRPWRSQYVTGSGRKKKRRASTPSSSAMILRSSSPGLVDHPARRSRSGSAK
jgi:hypothetical protein